MVVGAPRLQASRPRAMMPGAGQFLLAVILALAFAAPASATQPQSQQFRTIGQLTGANTVAGTWTSTGLIDGDGTYSETFRFAGETFHAQKVLVGRDGTIVLEIRGIVVWLDACAVTFTAGSWRISEATGTYAGIKAGGTPSTTVESVGNVCTGALDVVHAGSAHDG